MNNNWILTKDKLPENNDVVYATAVKEDKRLLIKLTYNDRYWSTAFGSPIPDDVEIVAWMPEVWPEIYEG